MVQAAGLLFWLVILPFCIGLVPAGFAAEEKRTPGFIFLAGYFTMWALFGLVTIPVVLFVRYDNFILASDLFCWSAILLAAAGVLLSLRGRKKKRAGAGPGVRVSGLADRVRDLSWTERIEWLLFFVLLCFQLYKAAAFASFDGDDAYYVVASLIAQQADTMYTILPLTGRHTGLDIRHAMAVFPMWIAFVAVRSNIHATALSHTVMPLVLIPLTYLIYYEIGRILFQKKRESLPVFLILMGMFQIFGNVSVYTNETFFLTRTWQGKAVAGSLVIPALLWVFLLLYEGRERDPLKTEKGSRRAGLWLLLVCINMTAGICSSIAVFLVSVLMAVTALCLAFVERDIRVLFRMGAACIPNAVYVLAYLLVGYGHLLE